MPRIKSSKRNAQKNSVPGAVYPSPCLMDSSIPASLNQASMVPTPATTPPVLTPTPPVAEHTWDTPITPDTTPPVLSTTPPVVEPHWDTFKQTAGEFTLEQENQRKQLELSKLCTGWPWDGDLSKLKTEAPWVHSGVPWTMSKNSSNKETLLFSKFLATDFIADAVMQYVFANREATDNFALLCQDSFEFGSWFVQHWDMTHGDFEGCELPRYTAFELMQNKELKNISIKRVVIITPVRIQGGLIPYASQIVNLYKMTLACHNFTDHLQNVQFHRVPLLTMHLLELIIPKLRKLTHLGVYNCQAIHIGKLLRLFQLLNDNADVQVIGKQLRRPHTQVKKQMALLDFYPRFHDAKQSPSHVWIGKDDTHSYGCTWDNWGGDSRQAIWAIVDGAVRYLRKEKLVNNNGNGLYFLTPGSAFIKWLHKSPVLDVHKTLNLIMNPHTDLAELAVSVRVDKFKGQVKLLTNRITGLLVPFPKDAGWWSTMRECPTCKITMPAIYWHTRALEKDNRRLPVKCMGCIMTKIMDVEEDNYKREKLHILGSWFKNGTAIDPKTGREKWTFETADMQQVLENFNLRPGIIGRARKLDRIRAAHIADAAVGGPEYDHELYERQRERPEQATTWKCGVKGMGFSPLCTDGREYALHVPRSTATRW